MTTVRDELSGPAQSEGTGTRTCDYRNETQSEGETSTRSCYSSYINLMSDSEEEQEMFDVLCLNNPQEIEKEIGNSSPQVSLQEIVSQHVGVVMDNDIGSPKNLVNIRRKHCFKDAINKLSRPGFMPSRKLSVRFADDLGQSEGAVDLGGPTREFLRLAIAEMYETSGMFGGTEKSKSLVPNSQARALQHYFMCGKLIAVSLCNGGVVGNCLSKPVYKFLVDSEQLEMVAPMVEHIPDYEKRLAVGQLQSADSETFSQALENVYDPLEQCGYSKPHIFQNREDMVNELCHYLVIDSVRSALEQFKEGLTTLDVLGLMRRDPLVMEEAFCSKESELKASDIGNIFLPVFDDPGSNNYARQELMVMHWRDYLQDCEAGCCNTTLGEVLSFVTGSDEIPPLGFNPQPMIKFWEDVRPKANTCGNTLYLPLFPSSATNTVAYEAFKENMDDGILNSPSFGLA